MCIRDSNNPILIIDFAKTLLKQGKEPLDAIIEASQLRLRPCLMTACTTMAATFPLAFGGGVSSALKSPMGITIISGVFSATVLTLFIIPLLYFLHVRRRAAKTARQTQSR